MVVHGKMQNVTCSISQSNANIIKSKKLKMDPRQTESSLNRVTPLQRMTCPPCRIGRTAK